MNEKEARARKWRRGEIVYYAPSPGFAFGAVVESEEPWLLGEHTPVVRLAGLGPEYVAHTQRDRRSVPCAACGSIRPAPTELIDGLWQIAREGEPIGIITYAFEASPETGDIGWCWWAWGKMGSAESYEAARSAVEAQVET